MCNYFYTPKRKKIALYKLIFLQLTLKKPFCGFYPNLFHLLFIITALDNANWPLKPLFFEVPSPSSTSFVGRKWLFREVLEHLSSDLPTSGGMIIQGTQATGKSSIILRLVQGSSFGHQGKHYYRQVGY